jgi:hypothetical protein
LKLHLRWDVMLGIAVASTLIGLYCSRHMAQYSAFTQRFLLELDKAQENLSDDAQGIVLSQRIRERFLVKSGDSGYVVHGIIKVDPHFDSARLEHLDILVRSRTQEIWGVIIPVRSLKPLGRVKGVLRIEIDPPVKRRH